MVVCGHGAGIAGQPAARVSTAPMAGPGARVRGLDALRQPYAPCFHPTTLGRCWVKRPSMSRSGENLPTPRSFAGWRKAIASRELSRSSRSTSLHREGGDARLSGRVMVTTPGELGPDYYRGRSVTVTGVLRRPPAARARELFDYRHYLADRGIHYELQCGSIQEWSLHSEPSDPAGPPWSDRFQRWARSALARGLPEDDESVGLLWTMLLGWRAGMTDDLADAFRHSGTMHVFAISGLHISMITLILVAIFRAVRVPRGCCWMIVLPAIWFYAAATGWQASAVRATLMSSLVLAGWSLRRPQDLLNTLAGAAWLILLWEPRQLFQVGFQLSFSVVLGIVLMLPHLERFQNRWLVPDPLVPDEGRSTWARRLRGAVREVTASLGISLAATLGSIPWMAYYFNFCTPVSLVANLAVVPLSAVALMSGLGSLLTAPWFPYASVLYNHTAWLAMIAMTVASQWSADLPGAWFYVASPSLVALAGYYLLLIALGADTRPYWGRAPRCRHGGGRVVGRGHRARQFVDGRAANHGVAVARWRQSLHRRAWIGLGSVGGHRRRPGDGTGRPSISAGAGSESTSEPGPDAWRRAACWRRPGDPGGSRGGTDHHQPGEVAFTRLSCGGQGVGAFRDRLATRGTGRSCLRLAGAASGGGGSIRPGG